MAAPLHTTLSTTQVVFVDSRVPDPWTLLADVAPGADIIVLDRAGNTGGAIAQITDALARCEGLEAVHIISHGAEGTLFLGDGILSAATLEQHADALRSWGDALSESGDLLLYGCSVGAGPDGGTFLEAVGRLTGADIAASTGLTGNAALGGDWILERTTGTVEAAVAVPAAAQAAFAGLLTPTSPFADLDGDSVSWAGVGNAVRLDLGGNTTIVEPVTWADATLTVQRATGGPLAKDVFGFDTTGLGFSVDGSSLVANGQAFATVTANAGGVLTIAFNGQASNALGAEVLRAITYRNDTPYGDAALRFSLASTGASGTADVTVASSTLYVDQTTYDTDGDVQDGFNLAEALAAADSGDTIKILAGTYRGQFVATKAVTIEGEGTGTATLEAPDTATLAASSQTTIHGRDRLPILDLRTTQAGEGTVTVRNLTIDGRFQGLDPVLYPHDNGYKQFLGIGAYDTNAVINRVTIKGIASPTDPSTDAYSGYSEGFGILAEGSSALTPVSVSVTNSTIGTFQKTGIVGWGPGLTATITDNTITAVGALGLSAQSGIQIGSVSPRDGTVATVLRNTISNLGSDSPIYGATGIILSQAGTVEVAGNTVLGAGAVGANATLGVSLYRMVASASIHDNVFGNIYQGVTVEGPGGPPESATASHTISNNDFNSTVYPIIDSYVTAVTPVVFGPEEHSETITVNSGPTVSNGVGYLTYYLFGGNDHVTDTGSAPSWFEGGNGNDTIVAGAGNDTLDGGAGADSLTGGAGTDVFAYAASGADIDTITDFGKGGADLIRVTGRSSADGTVTEGDGTAVAANSIQIARANGSTTLYIDVNGTSGAAELQVVLTGDHAPTAFLLDGTDIVYAGPVIAGLGGDATAYTLGEAPVLVDQGVAATLTDANLPANLNGGTLTVSLGGGQTGDVLGIRNQGTGAGQIGVDGSTVTYGGIAIGSLGGGTGGVPLSVSFGPDATVEAVQALLRNMTFANPDPGAQPGARTLTVQVTDDIGDPSLPVQATVNTAREATPPVVSAIAPAGSPGAVATSVTYTVTFAEDVTGVDPADFLLTPTGSASGTVSAVSGSGRTYTVTVDGITGAGALRLDLKGTGTGIQDLAGNALVTGFTGGSAHVVDRAGPVLSGAVVNGATLMLTYNEALDGAFDPAPGSFTVMVDGKPVAVATADAAPRAGGRIVVLTLAEPVAPDQTVTVSYAVPGDTPVRDLLGNVAGALNGQAVTNGTPVPEPTIPTNPNPPTAPNTPNPPVTELVDGVPVQTKTESDGAGGTRQVIEVPVVTDTRTDDTGVPSRADIPLVKNGNGASLLEAGLPVGVGLHVEGPTGGTQTFDDLIKAIEARTTGQDQTVDRAEMTAIGHTFLDELPTDTQLTVRTIVPTVPAGTTQAPAQPIVITAPASAAGTQEALVIDVRNLPSGTVIDLENVEFAAIVGAVKVTGGDGSQKVTGDGNAQIIVLGADDDVLHGGGGDDVVGSQGGNDRIHGDSGNDRMFGGADDDTLDGGTGIDVVRLTGKAADFTAALHADGSVTVADRRADQEGTDTLKSVELVRFEDGVRLPVVPTAPMAVFDEDLYLRLNADVQKAVAGGLFANGAEHYARFGAAEGRGALLTVDEAFYRAQNPDVDAAIKAGQFTGATQHFVLHGMTEGRDPNAFFWTGWYLSQNPDVAAAVQAGKTTAWQHFITFGWTEGRDASVWFDTSEYLAHNADVAAAGVNPLAHLLDFGMREGRLAYATDTGLWG